MGKLYLQTEVAEEAPEEDQDHMNNRELLVAPSNPNKKLNPAVKNHRVSGTPKQVHREVLQPHIA